MNDALLEWYAERRRDMPLRQTTDPYPTLVSEAKLEQTQVARCGRALRGRAGAKVRPKIVNCVGVEQP
jgi:hypothetical protein